MKTEINNLINAYADHVNNQRWFALADLHEPETCSLLKIQAERRAKNDFNGILNVTHMTINSVTEIAYEDVLDMLYQDYGTNIPIVALLEMEIKVKKNTKYFFNGVNFKLISLKNINGQWKIYELHQLAEPERLVEKNYCLPDNYNQVISCMNARRNGNFVDGKGIVYDQLYKCNDIQLRNVITKYTIPGPNTTVRLYRNGNIEELGFYDYTLAVSAGECRAYEFDGDPRKAINIAIKTYTWHYLIVPKNDEAGYDITTQMQAYAPSYISENSNVTVDMDALADIWMESYKGAIFAAYYVAGAKNSNGKNGGELKQNGCLYLIEHGMCDDFYECVHYYYDNSSASTGGPVRFFDSNKNELNH